MTGLRERKKQRTRETLIRTAIELFVEQGYERTTVDEIAAAADVSQRTFFRYFATKEEVAFALQDMIESSFYEAVRRRPAEEPPPVALRAALESVWDGIGTTIEDTVPVATYTRMWRTIETTPALIAVALHRTTRMSELLAAEIARREGVDPDTDPRPRVLVAAFTAVMQAAARLWSTGDDATLAGARAATMAYLDQLPQAVGVWEPAR
ncbi:TetR family transcriptional regulator [Streptomyces sp. NPDC051940]|uniref:TetR family transcriptional regulator n=1 Tax=Streptomyces sp. NPDC051940 TaxID=3155675 RepID=UPI00343038B7